MHASCQLGPVLDPVAKPMQKFIGGAAGEGVGAVAGPAKNVALTFHHNNRAPHLSK